MYISPQRRRRMFRTHLLRQDGLPMRRIAERLQVSVATVHADLRLLEDEWDSLTHAVHDDLLFQQMARLDMRLEQLKQHDPVQAMRDALGPDAQLSFEQIFQLTDRHQRQLANAERELRMLLKQFRNPYFRRDTPNDYPDDQLDDQLADPEHPEQPVQSVQPQQAEQAEQAERHRTGLNNTEHAEPPIPSKTRALTPHAAEKKFRAEQRENPFPRNTGRNQPCPCKSGKKQKHCHPQPPPSTPPGQIAQTDIRGRSPPTGAP